MTKPNVVSEAPPGVVSASNDEGLAGAARQVSGKAALANGSASQVNGSPEASGEVRTGDRARRRRAGLEKALRSHPQTTGTQFVAGNDTERRIKLKYNYMVMCDWKAEREQALRAPHSKVDIGRHEAGR